MTVYCRMCSSMHLVSFSIIILHYIYYYHINQNIRTRLIDALGRPKEDYKNMFVDAI